MSLNLLASLGDYVVMSSLSVLQLHDEILGVMLLASYFGPVLYKVIQTLVLTIDSYKQTMYNVLIGQCRMNINDGTSIVTIKGCSGIVFLIYGFVLLFFDCFSWFSLMRFVYSCESCELLESTCRCTYW